MEKTGRAPENALEKGQDVTEFDVCQQVSNGEALALRSQQHRQVIDQTGGDNAEPDLECFGHKLQCAQDFMVILV